ncbi:hypothetical protein DB88DRAFT_37248 [Papiliotrema laurentii]|uniref:Uncharacterized protein n=1 Tax=Papiliotrema laurentii TaxID=5418 RepID=A0AAD9L9J4_PAPLA|nr:hypothetical protein DB88DRAFT_37248 [Papiliotrema laurentii]
MGTAGTGLPTPIQTPTGPRLRPMAPGDMVVAGTADRPTGRVGHYAQFQPRLVRQPEYVMTFRYLSRERLVAKGIIASCRWTSCGRTNRQGLPRCSPSRRLGRPSPMLQPASPRTLAEEAWGRDNATRSTSRWGSRRSRLMRTYTVPPALDLAAQDPSETISDPTDLATLEGGLYDVHGRL